MLCLLFGRVLFLLLLETWNKVTNMLSNMTFAFLFHDLVCWFNKWAGHNIWDTIYKSTIHSWRLLKIASLMGKCENIKFLFESPLTLKKKIVPIGQFLMDPFSLLSLRVSWKKGSTIMVRRMCVLLYPYLLNHSQLIAFFSPPFHLQWSSFLIHWKEQMSGPYALPSWCPCLWVPCCVSKVSIEHVAFVAEAFFENMVKQMALT